jgi:hypothetical protein
MADLLQPPAVGPATPRSGVRETPARVSVVSARAAWFVLAALVAVSAAVRGFLATRIPTPWILETRTSATR